MGLQSPAAEEVAAARAAALAAEPAEVRLKVREAWTYFEPVEQNFKANFLVLACYWPKLYGFDQHFPATVNFPLTSAID